MPEGSSNAWHLDKKVPIGLMFAIFVQIIGLVLFFSKMDNRITAIEEWKIETSANRFTAQDALLMEYKVSQNQNGIIQFDQKLDTLIADMASVKAALNIQDHASVSPNKKVAFNPE